MISRRRTIGMNLNNYSETLSDFKQKKSLKNIIETAKDGADRSGFDYIYPNPNRLTYKGIDFTNYFIVPFASSTTYYTASITNGFNTQAENYINAITYEQTRLQQRTSEFLARQYASNDKLTSALLRDKGNWGSVKDLVTRQELMKLQMGGKTKLPTSSIDSTQLKKQIYGKDLSNFRDQSVNDVIDFVRHGDERQWIQAIRTFKETGVADKCLQVGKLNDLQKYLESIDLDNLTNEQFKQIKENYIECIEYHHRTSISADPSQQSNMDNIDTLNTTQHDAKHFDKASQKINYSKPTKEAPLNRINELKNVNRIRVLKNELAGIGLAAAIGLGTGFAIGFITTLAQNGMNPSSLRYAFACGSKAGAESMLLSAGSAVIGRTIGTAAGQSLCSTLIGKIGTNIAEETINNISKMCNMGSVGSLTIVALSVYQFAKLRHLGYSTRESLIRTGKTAGLSASTLIISIVAQGIWGGSAGIAVSIIAGVIITGVTVCNDTHDKHIRENISIHSIRLCYPSLS